MMDMQRLARRMVLVLVVVGLALPVLRTEATVTGPFDYDSRGQFEGECADLGGTFTDMGDNLWCQEPDGAQTVCDANGKDCYRIPVLRGSTGRVGPLPGSGGLATTNGGSTTPVAPIAQLPQDGAAPATASRTGLQASHDEGHRHGNTARTTAKGKHGRHQHRGKHNPR